MHNTKVVDLIDREIRIPDLPTDVKAGLRRFYYEMPTGVRADIAFNFREIFPEVTPRMFIHMNREDIEIVIKESSELLKVFKEEFKKARFSFPMEWFDRLKLTVFEGSWNADALMHGLNMITTIYSSALNTARSDPNALKFMVNYLKAWLRQKEQGMEFFCKTFHTTEYYRLTANPISLCEIIDEYLRLDKIDTASKIKLENLFYAILQTNPPESNEDNIFFVLDVIRAAGITPDCKYESVLTLEYTNVSTITSSEVADNVGQISIFGTHEFGTMSIEHVKEELMRLNRNTIAEYFGGKLDDTHIAFDIPEQVKMILREELSPSICVATIKRGNEVDMVTLITHESKTYLLFRKIGNDDVTFGIALNVMEDGARELIGISNESDFTYTLVGGEEIGIKE